MSMAAVEEFTLPIAPEWHHSLDSFVGDAPIETHLD